MDLASTALWVAIGTSAVSAIGTGVSAVYDALAYHRPTGTAMVEGAPTRRPLSGRFWIMTALPVIAWCAVGFDFADRHYFTPTKVAELPLKSENARLDIWKFEPGFRAAQSDFHLNVYVANKGNSTVVGMRHFGAISVASGSLDESTLVGAFAMLRIELTLSPPAPKSEIQIGDDHVWFTIPPVDPGFVIDAATQADLNSGAKILYVFNLMQYRDSTLESDRSIYTETCIYYRQGIQHYCDSGHNRNYISE